MHCTGTWAVFSLAVVLPAHVVTVSDSRAEQRHVRAGRIVTEVPAAAELSASATGPTLVAKELPADPDIMKLVNVNASKVLANVTVNQKIRKSLVPVAEMAGGNSGIRADAAKKVAEAIVQAVDKVENFGGAGASDKVPVEEEAAREPSEEKQTQSIDELANKIEKEADKVKVVEASIHEPAMSEENYSEAGAVGGTAESEAEPAEEETHILKQQDVVGSSEPGQALEGQTANTTSEEPIKEQIAERVEEAITDEVHEAQQEGREPTQEELHKAVIEELSSMLKDLRRRGRYAAAQKEFNQGVVVFFRSVAIFDWILLGLAFLIFLILYRTMLHWPSDSQYHWMGLIIWVAIAVAYFGLITMRQGTADGLAWAEGYLLEIIFLVENVFVFHIVVKAFQSPRQTTESALFVVMMCQVAFQMIFYMGLAHWLRSLIVLPYFLGVWLVYIGVHSAISNEEDEAADFNNSRIIQVSKACLGDRLDLTGAFNFSLWSTKRSTKCITKCGLMVFWLLVVDFFLEVDVTVAKIEFLSNPYLAFSSSVVATFAVPELFFIARDIFKRFAGLKYGVSTVLVMLGLEMLLQDVVQIPAIFSILALVAVMVLSGLISSCLPVDSGGSAESRNSAEDGYGNEAAQQLS